MIRSARVWRAAHGTAAAALLAGCLPGLPDPAAWIAAACAAILAANAYATRC